MLKGRLNGLIKRTQQRTFIGVLLCVGAVFLLILSLSNPHHKKTTEESTKSEINLTGIMDESFSDANTESAISQQQTELESLKKEIGQLKSTLEESNKSHEEAVNQLKTLANEKRSKEEENLLKLAQNNLNQALIDAKAPWSSSAKLNNGGLAQNAPLRVHSMTFHYRKPHPNLTSNHLNPNHYVPSGTFVSAVVLGGADADASVNGQTKNNGVMLFKLLQPGTLPNGQYSHLQGCFVTASSYGDISSERAYVILDKLSCAIPGQPIIDKAVTGWAFFGGKVGIKGIPLMRDNKILQWAGVSGAMSGLASAAQYSQSVQSINPLGSALSVPASKIGPYAAYGGASKAAELLSDYYVKRAEQYHPVIQVGSGNIVTIVFKDGFYLEPDEAVMAKEKENLHAIGDESHRISNESNQPPNFEVPPEVLSKIDSHYETAGNGEVSP